LIDGAWSAGSGTAFDVVNPATEETMPFFPGPVPGAETTRTRKSMNRDPITED
jgi:hypothetical protein